MSEGLAPDEAAKQAVARLTGAYSIAMIFKDHEGLLVGARKGAPLAVGYAEHEAYLGSDAFALAPFTNRVAYLEEGDVVVIEGAQVSIFDAEGRPANREIKITSASAALVDKAGHSHFMAKEIHEQPEVVGHTLAHYLDPAGPVVRRQGMGLRDALVKALAPDHLGLRHRLLRRHGGQILVREAGAHGGGNRCGVRTALSRSGLSRERRGAVRLPVGRDRRHPGGAARRQGQGPDHHRRGQCGGNLSIAREADIVLPTYAGPEIGVASTKAFTCQLAALACFRHRGGRGARHI